MRVPIACVVLFLGCSAPAETGSPSAATDSETVADSAVAADSEASDSNVASDIGMTTDTGTSTTDTGTSTTDTPSPPTYPAGPYGTAVGNVVANLELEGYVRFAPTTGLATSATYGPTSFAALRTTSPKKYALVHVSGFT